MRVSGKNDGILFDDGSPFAYIPKIPIFESTAIFEATKFEGK